MDASNINLNIEQKYGEKYTGILAHKLQQENSLLTPWVTKLPGCHGNAMTINYRSGSKMKRILSPYQDVENPIRDQFGSRQMKPVPFYAAHEFTCDSKLYATQIENQVPGIITDINAEAKRTIDATILGIGLDEEGIWRKLTTSKVSQVSADENTPYTEIIGGGLLGTNYLGKQGTVLVDLPEKQVIAADFVESGSSIESNITVGKIREGVKRLTGSHAHVPGVTTPVIALTSAQIMALAQQFEVSDPLWKLIDMRTGKLSTILGVNIVQIEMLPILDGTTNIRCCPLWIKEHMYFGAWDDLSVRVEGPREKRVNYGQVVAQMSYGATRKYESAVLEIQCKE